MSRASGNVPTFSILDVLIGLTRRKLFILSCLILGLLGGLAILTLIKPTYVAEARVLIDDLNTPYDSANVTQVTQRESQIDERVIGSQVAVMQSEDLSRRVIDVLQLGQLEEFDPMRKGLGAVSQFMIRYGFKDDPRNMSLEDRALNELSNNLTIFALEKSNVVGIKYESGSGKIAADVANTLAQTYVLSTREASSGTNNRAREWLSGQIDSLRTKVAASDAAVEKYRSDKGLFKSREVTLGNQEISELNSQITLAEAAKTEAEAKAQEIRDLLESQGSVDASSEVLGSATIQRLRELQVSASRRLSELSATYLPNHPKMIAAQRDVDNVEKQIRREALKIVESLQGQAKIAAKRAASLRKSLDGLKDRETVSAQDEVQLKELEREAKANRDQLEIMLARFADSNTRQNLELQPGFARVVQTASPPANPTFPKFGPTLLLTGMSGLLLGLGLAFLMEVMAQAAKANAAAFESLEGAQHAHTPRYQHAAHGLVHDERPIPNIEIEPERATSAPTPIRPVAPEPAQASPKAASVGSVAPALVMSLATFPSARTSLEARSLLDAFEQENDHANSLAQVSAQLLNLNQKGKLKACAVTGVGAGFEVAASSLAIGRELSRAGLKTILIDLEDKRPLIPDLMGLPFAPGMIELVSGQTDFGKAIQRDNASNLQLIRYGNADASSPGHVNQRMESVTRTLSTIYDFVLIHTGEASPATLNAVKGCNAILIYAPKHRHRDVAGAAATLRGNGLENVYMIGIEGPLQQAA